MAYWLADARRGQAEGVLSRFDPAYWTVNFPRPMMASVVTTAADALRVGAVFYRQDDLAGLIWEAEDRHDHPLLRYEMARDFTVLSETAPAWETELLAAEATLSAAICAEPLAIEVRQLGTAGASPAAILTLPIPGEDA